MKRTIDYEQNYPNKKMSIHKETITVCVLVAVMMLYFVYSVICTLATMYVSYNIHILMS
jgi:hypothetical protein